MNYANIIKSIENVSVQFNKLSYNKANIYVTANRLQNRTLPTAYPIITLPPTQRNHCPDIYSNNFLAFLDSFTT